MDLHVLSAGAAQGIVKALQPAFSDSTGVQLECTFGAVGIMKEELLAGAPCDVLILTAALIEDLAKSGHVIAGSSAPLGRVKTGVAVRTGQPAPDVSTPDALKASLLAARGIYFPDPERATAGVHFINVLKQLEIYKDVEQFLRPYPNGATAMRHLAQSAATGLIGCTQITEILYTDNVTLVAPLPKALELATVYSAAVCTKTGQPEIANRFVRLLTSEQSRSVRAKGGFEF